MPHFEHEGQALFYREQGEGPLLLVLPGNTASSACHEGELAYFGQSYRTIVPDFLGTGRSDRLEAWPDDWWERAARDALALVEHLGEQSCQVVGTSGGGIVALLMAIEQPARVKAVVADSCVARLPPGSLLSVLQDRERRTPEQVSFWRQAHGHDWDQVVEADTGLLLRFAESGGDWFAGRLREIRCPVLFVASLRDELLPNVCEQLCSMVEQVADSRASCSVKVRTR